MGKSKNINMFLIDGDVTGVIKSTLSNWTGVIYKIPRTKLTSELLRNRQDLKQSGVYFLIGKDEESGKFLVYIGQATNRKNGEGVLYRVVEHTKDHHSEHFNEVIILTTQTNAFGPTEISYLEHKFTALAIETARYLVRNSNEPNIGNVTEEKESELDEVIENAKMIIGTLGHRMFVPMIKPVEDKDASDETIFYLSRKIRRSGQVVEAVCKRTSEGFVVLKGSMIEESDSSNFPKRLAKIRNDLKERNIIQNGFLKEDQLFNTHAYAESFVVGTSTDGRDWKTAEGLTLKELEERELSLEIETED